MAFKKAVKKLIYEQERDMRSFKVRPQIVEQTLKAYVEGLTARERLVWFCVKSKVLTEKEIANQISISVVSVSRIFRRAKSRLKT